MNLIMNVKIPFKKCDNETDNESGNELFANEFRN